MTAYIFLLSIGLCLAKASWGGQATPEEAIAELRMRINSKLVDELLGPVDYEFVYFLESEHAYPLFEVKAFQETKAVEYTPDKKMIVRREAKGDSVSAEPIVFAPEGATGIPWGKAAEKAIRKAGKKVTGDPVSDEEVAEKAPPPETAIAYAIPFVEDSSKAVGRRPPKVRFFDDKKGDPVSFDLAEVDLAALVNRPRPSYVEGVEGVKLGILRATPIQQQMPPLTQIEQEHPLAERRVMRLEWYDFCARIATGVYLELELAEVKTEGERAQAQVRWVFTDQPEKKETSALSLVHTSEGWQIEKAWDFFQQLAAAR